MRVIYCLLQWTWGILQNIGGLAVFIRHIRCRHSFFHDAIVTEWDKPRYCATGMFIFVKTGCSEKLLVHEYGHTVQSAILGPLFIPVIGLPSTLWANIKFFHRYRRRKKYSYYSLYPEKWANSLGEKYTGRPSMGQAIID